MRAPLFLVSSFHLFGFLRTLAAGVLIRRFIRKISPLSAHGLCDFHVLISGLLARPSDAVAGDVYSVGSQFICTVV